MWDRIRLFLNPFDARYEDLRAGPWRVVMRDFSAGLIVAMMAIPMAMGFAMASGLRPEQGIVGGAVAGLMGALFGGSKYQVYGPTAAFIPLISGLMAAYATPEDAYAGHGFLVLAAVVAGIVLMLMGVAGLGKIANLVPHSIVVGFTIGIAVTIALSQIGDVLGISAQASMGHTFWSKLAVVWDQIGEFNGDALLLALVTFLLTKYLLKISTYLPAPLIAIGLGIVVSMTLRDGDELVLIGSRFEIPTDFFLLTAPALPAWDWRVVKDLAYFVAAIVFVSGVESLLCSRMADRLADNRGTPFNPNKEFWGQGLVQVFVPLLNGFPHTGALARTATNIKLGAVTPLSGIFKGVLKLVLAFFLASSLEAVPMACIGGILIWVAVNMVKPAEVKQVFAHNWFHVVLMIFTAGMVIVTDFLTGVFSAMVAYGALFKFLDKRVHPQAESPQAIQPPHFGEKNEPADAAALPSGKSYQYKGN